MNPQLAREIGLRTAEHLWLVLVPVAIAVACAVPAGLLLARRPAGKRWTVRVAGVLQTIPGLALFGLLLPLPLIGGIGMRTAMVALTLYAVLPIVQNTIIGVLNIDRAVRDSATALGMTPWQLLRWVEFPLALPAIIAGVRIATVTTIGTATIAAAIGGGGLGTFIFRGIAMVDPPTVLAGALPAALLAVVADRGWEWIERRYLPA